MTIRSLLGLVSLTMTLAFAAPAQADDPPPFFIPWTSLLPGIAYQYEPTSEDDCVAGRDRCVDRVIAEMRRRFDRLAARCDHDAVFSLSYLRTTEEYRRTIQDPDFFEDKAFVNHQDVVFAELYFSAYDAWRAGNRDATPAAWRIAFEAADDREVPAIGNMVLGINAHIQRDLPIALAAIGMVKPDGTSRKTDHDRVNQFLNRVFEPVIEELARRFDPTADNANLPTYIDNIVTFQVIPAWREAAWRNAERLATARTMLAYQTALREMEVYAASTAMLIRRLIAYLPTQTSAPRDAYCAANGR
jgi:hypothetical protein